MYLKLLCQGNSVNKISALEQNDQISVPGFETRTLLFATTSITTWQPSGCSMKLTTQLHPQCGVSPLFPNYCVTRCVTSETTYTVSFTPKLHKNPNSLVLWHILPSPVQDVGVCPSDRHVTKNATTLFAGNCTFYYLVLF